MHVSNAAFLARNLPVAEVDLLAGSWFARLKLIFYDFLKSKHKTLNVILPIFLF